ncbi:hypothetical protein HYALB_00002014 [Hymenoscyphus albidus]|uniref:F-box domain-containing protein n=1 Tax=Hymenoscyphus albidus TaxID=595503 RepID=A0A9N9Q1I7_9HELO|nr:hypothetical protein HYALB_00002014 [Hymenoscyphus albidus]
MEVTKRAKSNRLVLRRVAKARALPLILRARHLQLEMAHAAAIHKLSFNTLDQILIYLCEDGNLMLDRDKPITIQDIAAFLPASCFSNVLNFRQVNRNWNNVYRLRFEPRPKLLQLPAELLNKIVEHLAPRKAWPKKQKLIENRSTLSLESFSEHRPSPENDVNPLKQFRLVCRQFSYMDLCLEHLFSRVTTRFSPTGFETLHEILLGRSIRTKVKKFTYMVPRFYVGDINQLENMLKEQRTSPEFSQPSNSHQTASAHQRTPGSYMNELRQKTDKMISENIEKAKNQTRIIEQGIDSRALLLAFLLFKDLQQVKLLRVVDRSDEWWSRYLVRLRNLAQTPLDEAHLSWIEAYDHATKSLANAFLKSGNTEAWNFSCQFVDFRTPVIAPSDSILPGAITRLKFLTLQLIDEEGIDMTGKVLRLSQLCSEIMRQTRHLSGLHIGFSRVISAPLESVFHNTRWNHLRYFGIHMWSLDGEEIIRLLRRHPALTSVRLRQVSLKEGSRWEDVLRVIKQELNLKWLSLFEIGYGSAGVGPIHMIQEEDSDAEHDDNSGSESESDSDGSGTGPDESGSVDDEPAHGELFQWVGSQNGDYESEAGDESGESDSSAEASDQERWNDNDSDHEGAIGQSASIDPHTENHTSNPPPPDQDTAEHTLPECKCHDPISIADNGVTVDQRQWSSWELWATDSCQMHRL